MARKKKVTRGRKPKPRVNGTIVKAADENALFDRISIYLSDKGFKQYKPRQLKALYTRFLKTLPEDETVNANEASLAFPCCDQPSEYGRISIYLSDKGFKQYKPRRKCACKWKMEKSVYSARNKKDKKTRGPRR